MIPDYLFTVILPIGLYVLFGLLCFMILYMIFVYCFNFVKHLLTGKKLYMYEHIPSHGSIPSKFEWHLNDEEAKKSVTASWGDFIKEVYPKNRRIKPKS